MVLSPPTPPTFLLHSSSSHSLFDQNTPPSCRLDGLARAEAAGGGDASGRRWRLTCRRSISTSLLLRSLCLQEVIASSARFLILSSFLLLLARIDAPATGRKGDASSALVPPTPQLNEVRTQSLLKAAEQAQVDSLRRERDRLLQALAIAESGWDARFLFLLTALQNQSSERGEAQPESCE
eukprot:759823-Hanusia_phi.AAC.1